MRIFTFTAVRFYGDGYVLQLERIQYTFLEKFCQTNTAHARGCAHPVLGSVITSPLYNYSQKIDEGSVAFLDVDSTVL